MSGMFEMELKIKGSAFPAKEQYRYVNKVGVELEGGWNAPLDFQLDHDGSVHVDAEYVGEVPSPPLKPRAVPKWMLAHYPDAVNDSCGMHVHVSVNHQWHYAKLMEPEFFSFIKAALKAWGQQLRIRDEHPFWSRLKGQNRYCLDEFRPDTQIVHRDKGGDRYTMLNYTWARYRTVECRVLPAFASVEIAISAVYAVVDSFETYLRANCKSEAPSFKGIISANELADSDDAPLQSVIEI